MISSSRLFKLKSWFSLQEAVQKLNLSLENEKITEVDLLNFALDNHINLSAIIHGPVFVSDCFKIKSPEIKLLDNGQYLLTDYLLNGECIVNEFSNYDECNNYLIGYFNKLQSQCSESEYIGNIRHKGKITYLRCYKFINKMSSSIIFDFPLTDGNESEIKNIIRRLSGKSELDGLRSSDGIHICCDGVYHEFFELHKKSDKYESTEIQNFIRKKSLPEEIELVITKNELERFENLLLEDSSVNFTIEDYQNILFSLKELVCSKTKKWSQDTINNELDNAKKGMSKRRLESLWPMLNKKYKP